MKLYTIIFLTLLFTMFSEPLLASHSYGGEMSWTCLTNGQYQFEMTFYRDCSGIPWVYEEEVIEVVGSPLPKDGVGASFSSIIMIPDSNRWLIENNGDLAVSCTKAYGAPLNCADGDNGVIQQFFYKSDPFDMAGVPPTNGWKFYWTSACCRPGNLENVVTNVAGITNSVVLRAIMFPTKNRNDVDPCLFSSPEFGETPTINMCRGEIIYNNYSVSQEGDSLSYTWDKAINPPVSAPNLVPYKMGYNFNNPTPDTSFDSKNVPSSIDSTTGMVKLGIYSGVGVQKFLNIFRVDAWRDGVKIGSVFRELPLTVFDCPKLPSNFVNKAPTIRIDSKVSNAITLDLIAGKTLRIPLAVKDLDNSGVGSGLQNITMQALGQNFSSNFKDTAACLSPPCAYLTSSSPAYDSTERAYLLEGLGGLNTEFIWKTDCSQLSGKDSRIFNFYFNVKDDHCPIPAVTSASISIRLLAPSTLSEPIVKGASVGLDGKVTYQWAAPIDSGNSFHIYKVERAAPEEAFTPSLWQEIDSGLANYQSRKKYEEDFGIYRNINNDPTLGSDILRKNLGAGVGLDWYLRMTTISGCADTAKSKTSEAVRVIELSTVPGGSFPASTRGRVDLSWNRAKPLSATTKPYFKYDSPTTFYIWENDSIDNGEVAVEENWYVRGSTQQTTYNAESNVCGRMVGFRVEARDTIISWKQGNGLRSDSLDTLIFSTFSVIDTFFMVQNGMIPKPNFDTVQVLKNGDVYLKVNVANAGTIGEFEIFENNTAGTELTSFDRSTESSFTVVGADANTTARDYTMRATNGCNPAVTRTGDIYTTIKLEGSLLTPCPPTYRLNWNQPTGFPNGVQSYKVYSQVGNEAQKLRAVISDPTITTIDLTNYGRGLDYEFQVIAEDENGAVNISSIHTYTTDLRTDEEVPAPEFYCSFVNQDGSVTLTFSTPRDSTSNRVAFEFDYRVVGASTWTFFGGSSLVDTADNTVTITGINAQQEQYEFRARTRSGCDETYLSSDNEIKSIFLTVTPKLLDVNKQADLQWDDEAVPFVNEVSIYKYPSSLGEYVNSLLADYPSVSPQVDGENSKVCDESFNYHLQSTAIRSYEPGKSCESRSNLATATYRDSLNSKPNFIFLDDRILKTKVISDNYQWYDCNADTIISGATESTYFPNDTGLFALIVSRCDIDTSKCIPIFPVGLEEQSFRNVFTYYPNPTNGKIFIYSKTNFQRLTAEVRTLEGQLISEQQFLNQQQMELNLDGAPGIYFIQLTNEQGERTNLKVVKQ